MSEYNHEEEHNCPTCDLITSFTNILLDADYDEYRDILTVLVNEAKDIGRIEHIIGEMEKNEMYLDFLINGAMDSELN